MGRRSGRYRVVVINPLGLALLPQLLVHYIDKRKLAFSLTRDNVMGLFGILFIGLWLFLGTLFMKYLWIFSYIIFFIYIGSLGTLILLNTYVMGIIFIRKECYNCKFKNIIIDHESIHLEANFTEKEVWDKLKNVYTAQQFGLYDNGTICDHCPIPAHLIEE